MINLKSNFKPKELIKILLKNELDQETLRQLKLLEKKLQNNLISSNIKYISKCLELLNDEIIKSINDISSKANMKVFPAKTINIQNEANNIKENKNYSHHELYLAYIKIKRIAKCSSSKKNIIYHMTLKFLQYLTCGIISEGAFAYFINKFCDFTVKYFSKNCDEKLQRLYGGNVQPTDTYLYGYDGSYLNYYKLIFSNFIKKEWCANEAYDLSFNYFLFYTPALLAFWAAWIANKALEITSLSSRHNFKSRRPRYVSTNKKIINNCERIEKNLDKLISLEKEFEQTYFIVKPMGAGTRIYSGNDYSQTFTCMLSNELSRHTNVGNQPDKENQTKISEGMRKRF